MEEKDPYSLRAVTHRMIVANQMHRRMMEQNLLGTGLHHAQHRLLMTLAERNEHTQVELARRLEVSPATIAVSLKNLEKNGWILRRTGREDNRVNFVELTEKGRKLVEESKEFFDAVDREMYRGFEKEDLIVLSRYMEAIYENMDRMLHGADGGKGGRHEL